MKYHYSVEKYKNSPRPRPVTNYFAHPIREIYQVLPYSVDYRALGSFEIHLVHVRQYCSFISNKIPVNIRNDRKAPK